MYHMHNLSSKKAQFFILTAVIIVGVFFTLSKYISQHSFIDTSEAVSGAEVFMFENIVDKANKTVQISNVTNIQTRLSTYSDFVEEIAADRGYRLAFNYTVDLGVPLATFNISLMSEKYTLSTGFSESIPLS